MDTDIAAARRAIAATMIDRLKVRLPGHTTTQRLALLRLAGDELRRRALAKPPPIELAEAGKASPREQAFGDVSDVLIDELAAILAD